MYSGYVTVDASAGRNLFYWLATSASNAATDPLLLWLTGGPGCSSLFALTTEHGPLQFNASGSLNVNPFSWNARANVIYLEAPAGVGYSYAADCNYTTGDDAVAADNYAFLRGFLQHYPEYAGRPFFVSGESYAGHYVPQLSSLLVAQPIAGLNFRGFMVGNPSFDGFYDSQNFWTFMAFHGLASTAQYNAAYTACNGTFAGNSNPACSNATQVMRPLFIGLNPYNILAPCQGPPSTDGSCFTAASVLAAARRPTNNDLRGPNIAQTVVPCINISAPVAYFQRADVRAALHVSPLATQPWDVCSTLVNYTQYAFSVRDLYVDMLTTSKLRVLVYSGDADTCVPYLGTEASVDSLGFAVSNAYRQWHYNDTSGASQIAGYVREYTTAAGSALGYATVKGTGHMVPTWAPVQALVLVNAFLSGGPPA